MSSTFVRNQVSNAWPDVASLPRNSDAPGPSTTTTASWLPSGFCWSQAACVVSPMRWFISSNSALRAPFVSAIQDFQQYLRETHLPLVTGLPGLRRLVVNWVLPDPNEPPPAYDAVSEDWFDDPAAMGAALASPEGQAVAADVPN